MKIVIPIWRHKTYCLRNYFKSFVLLILVAFFGKELHNYRSLKEPERSPTKIHRRFVSETLTTLPFRTVRGTATNDIAESYRCPVSYLGCVINKNGLGKMFERLMEPNLSDVTPKKCTIACYNRGLELSMVQGSKCACAKFISTQQTIDVDPTACTQPCPGDPTKSCGGKEAMQIYYRTAPCRKGPFTQREARLAEYGCFQEIESIEKSSTVPTPNGKMQPITCLIMCERREFPLAVIRDSNTCYCAKFSKAFDRVGIVNSSSCDNRCSDHVVFSRNDLKCGGRNHVSVWRTLAEDRCGKKSYLPRNTVPPVGLVSMPGSGNSWLRYLLETSSGVYTGSVYHSMPITRKGMFGELDPIDSNRTLTIKDHVIYRGITGYPHKFEKIILLLRNPFDALIAEFNRRTNGSQTGHVTEDYFKKPQWQGYIKWILAGYAKVYKEILNGDHPLLIVKYDDLQEDKNKQLKLIYEFVGYHPPDLNDRLHCLERNDVGFFKRTKSKPSADPYTVVNVKAINGLIAELRTRLENIGYLSLPAWERKE